MPVDSSCSDVCQPDEAAAHVSFALPAVMRRHSIVYERDSLAGSDDGCSGWAFATAAKGSSNMAAKVRFPRKTMQTFSVSYLGGGIDGAIALRRACYC